MSVLFFSSCSNIWFEDIETELRSGFDFKRMRPTFLIWLYRTGDHSTYFDIALHFLAVPLVNFICDVKDRFTSIIFVRD